MHTYDALISSTKSLVQELSFFLCTTKIYICVKNIRNKCELLLFALLVWLL